MVQAAVFCTRCGGGDIDGVLPPKKSVFFNLNIDF